MGGKVTCVSMDVVTAESGHSIVPNAVSVCLTPCAPSPVPIPYPVVASVSEGISDTPMRTKVNGVVFATTGSVLKTCHGNEAGTLKEVVSLNTTGPVFPIIGAPVVLAELGMVTITGSVCVSNKAPTPGAGGNASDASGSGSPGGGSGSDGSGDGSDKDKKDPKGGGGADGDGSADGSTADPPSPAKNEYCADHDKKAPPDHEAHIEDMDLRNHYEHVKKHGTKQAKEQAALAMDGHEGGGKGFAFWSSDAGRAAAAKKGFKIQEDVEGAGGLEAHGKKNQLPDWQDDQKAGAGSKITNERLWKTISRRSAEKAHGQVDAFVEGGANRNNVFATIELPTLLHNKKVKEIKFHPSETSWKRDPPSKDCPSGKWKGPPINGMPPGPSKYDPKKSNGGGVFSLDPTKGIAWDPP